MTLRKYVILVPLAAVLIGGGLLWWLTSADAASAQCGSQASSCKNCHEVQGEAPVNAKGDWHIQHQFGDFCANCHAGNVQATDKAAAHTGMVAPLSDLQANCASCHPADTTQRAQKYADILGVALGSGSPAATPAAAAPAAPAAPAPAANPSANTAPVAAAFEVKDPNVIDYARTYNETVLGQYPVNWGNVALGFLLVALVAGGGGYAYWNERRLHHQARAAAGLLTPEEYPDEILRLLPAIERLTPAGRAALQEMLKNPQEASALLPRVARLDPETAERIRTLDADLRAILLALTGDEQKGGVA